MQPETRYAKSSDVNIAYQVVGEGPLDLVFVMGWVSHLEYFWEEPLFARFLRRLASFSRLILFDKRGTGLYDRVPNDELPTLEQRMDDVRAVMDAVGSERAALIGVSEGATRAGHAGRRHPAPREAGAKRSAPGRPVGELGREAGCDRLGSLAPEACQFGANELGRRPAAAPRAGEAVEDDRAAEDDGARPASPERPAEGVEPAGNDRNALLHRDHHSAGLNGTGIPEPLPRSLDEDADDVPLAHERARPAERFPVSLAAPHRKSPGPAQDLADHRDREQLFLRHVVDRAAGEDADERRVDRREVVRRQHRTAGRRHALDAVGEAGREPARHSRDEVAHEPPQRSGSSPQSFGTARRVSAVAPREG